MSSQDDDPLVQRVDALLRRQAAGREPDVPILTEILDDEQAPPRRAIDPAVLEALARELERAVLERVGAELERALERMHAELQISVTHLVREAVAASIARALALPKRD